LKKKPTLQIVRGAELQALATALAAFREELRSNTGQLRDYQALMSREEGTQSIKVEFGPDGFTRPGDTTEYIVLAPDYLRISNISRGK
jgi:hypothetical protein